MLQLLSVRDLALVDHVQLELSPGLNVLTGETGAGKSILISALSLVLGGRASADMVRAGSQDASVEALFTVAPGSRLEARLADHGIDAPEGELLVRRAVGAGRSRVYLNGQLGTVSLLQSILRGVVDITSQHEHVSLLDPDQHADLLDRWCEARGLRDEVQAAFHAQAETERALEGLDEDEATRLRRLDYLRYAVDEFRRVEPQSGELERLEGEREGLQHAERIQAGLARAEARVYGAEGSASDHLGGALRELQPLVAHAPWLAEAVEQLERLLAEAEDLGRGLGAAQRGREVDVSRLEAVDDRLDAVRRLIRKHGGDEARAFESLRRMEEELAAIEDEDERRAGLTEALEARRAEWVRCAEALTAARRQGAARFVAALEQELAELSMQNARLDFEFRPFPAPRPRGAEAVELMGTMNPGEPLRALRRIASGGELSRLLLALKQVQAERGGIQTYVFDEVDTGIGGAVADVLGSKLRSVARGGQVLCVTHLAPVAAYADVHFVVQKAEKAQRTVTVVRRLDDGARVAEVARMLGSDSARSRSLAEEMIESARGRRTPGRRSRRSGRSGR
jgi:DNA repair protein RecN (Recombination protein N)